MRSARARGREQSSQIILHVDHWEKGGVGGVGGWDTGDPAERRLFLSGPLSLIHSVRFEEERASGSAWTSLEPVWLEVGVGPGPIVTRDPMA